MPSLHSHPPSPPPLITLTTDFGLRDTYVAQIKGVILGILPHARIVDITHEVSPQDVTGGCLALESALHAFNPSTIHAAIIDPGVGANRAAVAMQTALGTFVGPDNGVLTSALGGSDDFVAVTLTNESFHRRPPSPTFHGRDIFAPAAAHLAAGVSLNELGDPIENLVTLDMPGPVEKDNGLNLIVLATDRFGNLITNLTRERWQHRPTNDRHDVRIDLAGRTLTGIARTFGDVEPGTPVAYFGSGGRLEIALRDGDAAAQLGAGPGTPLKLRTG